MSFTFQIPFYNDFFPKKKKSEDEVVDSPPIKEPMYDYQDYVCTDELLGKGGCASVYAGFQKSDNCKLAFKVCPIKEDDLEYEIFLKREIKTMKLLLHPNIVKFQNYFQQKNDHVIVLECLEGGELLDRILSKSHFTEEVARDTLLHILAAVKHCHDNNIIHRDIKPENFLLSSHFDDATTKLADFGFAIKVDGDSADAQLGTPGYIAPEILENKNYGGCFSISLFNFL